VCIIFIYLYYIFVCILGRLLEGARELVRGMELVINAMFHNII
jgi:hypothetical protein